MNKLEIVLLFALLDVFSSRLRDSPAAFAGGHPVLPPYYRRRVSNSGGDLEEYKSPMHPCRGFRQPLFNDYFRVGAELLLFPEGTDYNFNGEVFLDPLRLMISPYTLCSRNTSLSITNSYIDIPLWLSGARQDRTILEGSTWAFRFPPAGQGNCPSSGQTVPASTVDPVHHCPWNSTISTMLSNGRTSTRSRSGTLMANWEIPKPRAPTPGALEGDQRLSTPLTGLSSADTFSPSTRPLRGPPRQLHSHVRPDQNQRDPPAARWTMPTTSSSGRRRPQLKLTGFRRILVLSA